MHTRMQTRRFLQALAFLAALGALGSMGHLHQVPSWWVARLAVTVIEGAFVALCLAAVSAKGKRGSWGGRLRWVLSFRFGAVVFAVALVIFLARGLAVPASAVTPAPLVAHHWSQLNMLLLVSSACLVWPALFARRVANREAGRFSFVVHVAITMVVTHASLHVVRQYQFHDAVRPWFLSMVAFAIITTVCATMAWLFTTDWLVATASSKRRHRLAIPTPTHHPLELGLATSGGGIRAAVVATGVLQSLRKSALWQRIRFVSAVSGGSWALANFLTAEARHPTGDDADRAARVAHDSVAQLRDRRDYVRGGGGVGFVVRPFAVAFVGTLLQLSSLVLSLVFLIVWGLYLAELSDQTSPSVVAWFLKELKATNGHPVHEVFAHPLGSGLEKLEVLWVMGEVTVVVALFVILVGLGLLLVARVRLVPLKFTEPIDRAAAQLVLAAAVVLIAAGVPMMVLASVSTLVVVAVVAAVGWAYVKEWELEGLRSASLFGAIIGAVSVVGEQFPVIRNARQWIDDHAKTAVSFVIENAAKVSQVIQDFASRQPEQWPREEAKALSLLVCLGVIGALYLVASLLIRLELVGLGSVWRSWVAAFTRLGAEAEVSWPSTDFRPEPIVNMTVNAPNERFEVAHFEATPSVVGGPSVGYHPQGKPQRVRLLDAIAISSAALNSQAGRFVGRWLRPILSILSLKLGRWLPHPRTAGRETWPLALHYMNRELLGWNSLDDAHLFLSDGGHFENLGAYALMLRRVQTMVIVDAAADPSYQFEDLSRFIELAGYRGYHLDLAIDRVVPSKDCDESGLARPKANVVVGWLRYEKTKRAESFWKVRPPDVRVIYAKLGLPPALGARAYAYARQNPQFPQQSTIDQFFDEAQFEAYLEVGTRLGEQIVEELTAVERAGFSAP